MKHNSELEDNIRKYEDAKAKGESIYLDVDALMDIADYYYSKDYVSKAIEIVDYAITLFPGATLPLCYKARKALGDKDIDTAQQYADQIEDKSDVEYIFLKAEMYTFNGEANNADLLLEHTYDNTVSDEQDDFAVDAAKMFFDYEADEYCKKWLDTCRDKENTQYQELLSRWYMAKKNFDEAEKLLNSLLDKNPFSAMYWTQLASAQFLANNIEKGFESCDYALAIDADYADAVMFKANCLSAIENYTDAIPYYQKYTQLVPKSEVGHMFLGICYSNTEQYQEAIPCLLKAEEYCDPNSDNALPIYKELAFCYSSLRKLDEALAYIDKAEQHQGSDKAEISCLRGICYMANGNIKDAEYHLNIATALADEEQRQQILIDFSAAAIDCHRPDIAYHILHTILDNGTSHTDGWSFYALACFQLGYSTEFLQSLQKACDVNPTEAHQVLNGLFPQGTPVEDYVSYSKKLLS